MSCPGDGRWVHMRKKPVRLPFLGTSLFNTSSWQTSWILCPRCVWQHRAAGGGWAACGHCTAGGSRAGCSLAQPCWGTASLSHLAPVCWADVMAESLIEDHGGLLSDLMVRERPVVPKRCCWDKEDQPCTQCAKLGLCVVVPMSVRNISPYLLLQDTVVGESVSDQQMLFFPTLI